MSRPDNPPLLTAPRPSPGPFHVMAKPAGPACNLACTYCFYLEKNVLFPAHQRFRMTPETLEAYTRNYIASHPAGVPVNFAWQGGEPTLLGVEFFRQAVALQKRYGEGREIQNAFQTNGTLLNDEWCKFLAQNHFLIGLSLDGPADVHDHYRRTRAGGPTHRQVMHGLKLLRRHRVEYNILACINRYSARHPLKVYRFFRDSGVEFIQFIPIVERQAMAEYVQLGLKLSGPRKTGKNTKAQRHGEESEVRNQESEENAEKSKSRKVEIGEESGETVKITALPKSPDHLITRSPDSRTQNSDPQAGVTTWSVLPNDYGEFFIAIFDEWVRHDVGKLFVMNFEWALANYLGSGGTVCVHQPTCGRAVIVEHDGEVYACDHYVYPEYRRGNVRERSLAEMVDSPAQAAFGQAKSGELTAYCRQCPVLPLCWGDCPKHRFAAAPDGAPGLSYLCPGFRRFFTHLLPYMQAMGELLRAGRSPTEIMRMNINQPAAQASRR